MIAGEVISFIGNSEDPEVAGPSLIELTDCSDGPFIELAANVGKRRVYFRFRMADLVRELDEAKGDGDGN
jgi:hypothetical protein